VVVIDGASVPAGLGGLQRAAVLSDGATRLVDRFGLLEWPNYLDVLAE
jgi:hypothetical protein